MSEFVCIASGAKLKTDNPSVEEQYRKHPEAYKEVKKAAPKAKKAEEE